MSSVTLDEIIFDESIYPRAAWSQDTVNRYADALEAGEHFPPIVLEVGTRRLLDGKHRVEAHRATGRHFVAADLVEIPDGVPAVLYAASLSSRHGDPLAAEDKRRVAREIATASPDYSMVLIAQLLGTTRQTVSNYVGDIVEHRREVRKAKAALLARSGKSVREIADELAVSKSEVSRNVAGDNPGQLTEDVLREAAKDLPIDAAPIVEEILRERDNPPIDPMPEQVEPPTAPAPEEPPAVPPSAMAVTPEQRQQIVDDAERVQSIDNARKKADRLLPEVSALITEIVSGVRYGEPGLITAEMVAGLRAEADRLEQWMEKQ